jgi:hypothetical protein
MKKLAYSPKKAKAKKTLSFATPRKIGMFKYWGIVFRVWGMVSYTEN